MDTTNTGTAATAERYRKLAAEFTRRVEGVPADGWELHTPCAGWTARDLLRHLIDVHKTTPEHAGITLELSASIDSDPVAAWHEARAAMQEVLDDPAKSAREYDGYFGRISVGRSVDDFLDFDLLVHSWDLARATGQDERLPGDEVTRVFETARGLGESIRMEGVCGPEVSVSESAPEQDRLLGYLGRQP